MFTLSVYNGSVIARVVLARRTRRQLTKVPRHIVLKLQAWVEMIETESLEKSRKIPGYHDEPLSGERRGQRSIRLSRSYRAIYEVRNDEMGGLVSVEEVSKHDY